MKQQIKKWLFGSSGCYTIKAGIARGLRMYLDPQHASQVILGLAEAEIAGTFKKLARQADAFFDIGAASGYYSILYRKYNPQGNIFMFDAEESFLPIQIRNILLNSDGHQVAQYTLFVSDETAGNHVSIDTFVQDHRLQSRKLFFKIDVDGGEEDVLKGMQATMGNCSCVFIIETHSIELEENCQGILQHQGYVVKVIPNAWWRIFIKENRPIPHNRWMYVYKPSGKR